MCGLSGQFLYITMEIKSWCVRACMPVGAQPHHHGGAQCIHDLRPYLFAPTGGQERACGMLSCRLGLVGRWELYKAGEKSVCEACSLYTLLSPTHPLIELNLQVTHQISRSSTATAVPQGHHFRSDSSFIVMTPSKLLSSHKQSLKLLLVITTVYWSNNNQQKYQPMLR